MPRRDNTGPMGAGAMTGRALGVCANNAAPTCGSGIATRPALARRCGFGRGVGRGFRINETTLKTQKELLQEQKELLQNRLNALDKQLENL